MTDKERAAVSNLVRKLQEGLRKHGYPVPDDGIFGPETKYALIEFQQAENTKRREAPGFFLHFHPLKLLNEKGVADGATLRALFGEIPK